MSQEPAFLDATELLRLQQGFAESAHPFALATVIRALPPTSAWVGAQALVERDGTLHGWVGGGCARAIVVQAAQEAIDTGQAKRVSISNLESGAGASADVEHHAMPCASNGTLEIFVQPFVPAPAVLIFGATPAAREALVLAERMGLRTYSAAQPGTSGRPEPGTHDNFDDFEDETDELPQPQLALVATQGDGDEDALEAALRGPAAAILLIASPRKAERLRELMRARGIPDTRLAALQAPAGPAIHARTPQEIALGAVAGLVTARRMLEQRAAETPNAPPADMPEFSTDGAPTRYLNPVCGMAIDIASAKHVVEFGGERVYFCCDGCKLEFERAPEKYLGAARDPAHREVL